MDKELKAPPADAKPEVKSEVSDAKDTEVKQPVKSGNSLADRTRADIYERFDAQTTKGESDTSSEKEESATDSDLKQESDSAQLSDKEVENTEKPTSVKKGRGPKADADDQKMVPLQALHESRERFKKLNLEYRDFKASAVSQEKEINELKAQLAQLSDKLRNDSSVTSENDLSEETDVEKHLRREISDLKKRFQVDESEKAKEAALKAQQDQQKKIETVTHDLTKEGFPGFDIAVLKTGVKLQELVTSGELTESESLDPDVWKKVYKEHIYPNIKTVFGEREKEEIMAGKKEAKKKASLVADPGKAPEKKEKKEEEITSYDQFVKMQMKERMDDHKKKFYGKR